LPQRSSKRRSRVALPVKPKWSEELTSAFYILKKWFVKKSLQGAAFWNSKTGKACLARKPLRITQQSGQF
jgi:hypothetical protein